MSVATLLAASSIPAQALENMIYVPVDPCRLVDTRNAGGAITADSSRNFLVSGSVTGQGGTGLNNNGTCLAPRSGSEPLAISAYVLAIPPDAGSAAGILTALARDPRLTLMQIRSSVTQQTSHSATQQALVLLMVSSRSCREPLPSTW
jgi:hypothetical protein